MGDKPQERDVVADLLETLELIASGAVSLETAIAEARAVIARAAIKKATGQ